MSSQDPPQTSQQPALDQSTHQPATPEELNIQAVDRILETYGRIYAAHNGAEPRFECLDTHKPTESNQTLPKDEHEPVNGTKENQKPYRPRTPPAQIIRALVKEHSDSPDSQVIASGDCSPRSEGVKRADRKDVRHWPGAQESCEIMLREKDDEGPKSQ